MKPETHQHTPPSTMGMLDSIFTYAYLMVLYFLQGVPYGVQDKLLPQHLRAQKFSYSNLTLARILLVPWLCKPVFASFIEKRLTQKQWLQIFLVVMTVITWLSSYFGDNVWSFVLTLFVLNVVSACFDISVDTVAMDILHGSQVALGTAVQVGAYKVGAIFGGGVLFLLQLLAGVKGILRGMSVVYALGLIMVTFKNVSNKTSARTEEEAVEETLQDGETVGAGDAGSPSTDGLRRRKPQPSKDQSTSDNVAVDEVPDSFLAKMNWACSVDGTMGLVLFLSLYKAGEYGILTTYPSFLLDRGYSYFVVGFLNGGLAQVISILGSIAAGYMARSSRNNKSLLLKLCIFRLLPAALICITNTRLFGRPKNVYFGVAGMLVLNLVSGMITTVVFTMMMGMSQKLQRGLRSTHFAFLCTVEVVGKLAASVLVGPCIDLVGKTPTYFVMTALTALSIAAVRHLK